MRVQFSVNYRINFLKRRPRRDRFVRRNIEVKKKGDSQLISIGSGASIPFVHISCESQIWMSECKRMRLGRKVLRENKGCTGGLSRISRWKWNFQHDRDTGSIKDRITSRTRYHNPFSLTYKNYLCRYEQRERMYILYIILQEQKF